MRARVLQIGHLRPRAANWLRNIADSAPNFRVDCVREFHYQPFDGVLIVYGCGRQDIADAVRHHVRRGQPALCWDVGYFGRAMRAAWGGHHPTWLPDLGPERWDATGIQLREDYDPNGPIVLVGLGPKSRYMGRTWEADALERIRAVYPDRRVIYRPKPRREFVELRVETDRESPIEKVLEGASLVVTRHSNVGIDACIAGIPVVTELGAAALLYGNDISSPVQPSTAERLAFLRNLAWLNWGDHEAAGLWPWIKQCVTLNRMHTG